MSESSEFATLFVTAVVDGDVARAHGMLTEEFAGTVGAGGLAENYKAIAEDMGGVSGIGEAMELLKDWPGKAESDIAMVYVPLEGDVYSEAITVTVARIEKDLHVSGIEWGRP
jgi:hypothetical protein